MRLKTTPADAPPPAARRRLSEAERREQILSAAFEIARRDGLDAVTARNVAKAAGLSNGLVFVHFETTEALLVALVDSVTDAILAKVHAPQAYAPLAPRERLLGFLSDRLRNLDQADERAMVELLLEVWVRGLRRDAARGRVRGAIERYRAAFVPLARNAIECSPERFHGVTADSLAHAAVSLVIGAALQAIASPKSFDHAATLATLRALLLPDASAPSRRTS